MDNLFCDYETFWDVGYSLRSPKISTTDYIHDERFSVHGASVAWNKGVPEWLGHSELVKFFNSLRNREYRFIGHHTLFDGYITKHVYNTECPQYFCTMGMIEAVFQGAIGRGLDEGMTTLLQWEQGKTDILAQTKGLYWSQMTANQQHDMIKYANEDLRATQELFYTYADELPYSEWEIMSLVLKMFCRPRLEFDSKLLVKALGQAHLDRDENIETALTLFNCTEKDLSGNLTFIALLESIGYVVPMKKSPSVADKMIPAFAKTDQGFQNMLEEEDPRVSALAQGRMAVKSTQGITRAQRFIDLDDRIGTLPVAYNYYRAHTGRLSGGNKINLTNLKAGSDLRKSVVAPKGFGLAVADSSQIECRNNGYIAKQEDLMELFREERDPYNDMASEIFGRTIDRKAEGDLMEGFIGKTAVLGLGYQMGGPKFKATVEVGAKVRLGIDYHIEEDEAYRIVDVYRAKNYMIERMWSRCNEWLHLMAANAPDFNYDYGDSCLRIVPSENKIYFPNDTWLYLPCLSYDDGNFTYIKKLGKNYVNRYIYGGKLVENIIQKFSRDIVSWQMINISRRYDVVLHTYDENVALVPMSEIEEGTQWVIDEMKRCPSWASMMPINAAGGWAKEYSK